MAKHEQAPSTAVKQTKSRGLRLRRTTAALATGEGMAWAPLVAALAVDLADFATAGPLGLIAGLAVGSVLTGVVSLSAGAKPRRALMLAMLGALYCALPLTEALPMATMLTLVHGWVARRNQAGAQEQVDSVEAAPMANSFRVVQVSPPVA